LELITDLHAVSSHVSGDPVRLQQIFWNLIRNAIKFTPEGGRIMISSYNEDPGHISVQVADNGIGIDPQRLSLIFQAFEQGGRDITARFGGLGLGLAIAQGLTQAHGGVIRAVSEGTNRGSIFTVQFPTSADRVPESETRVGQSIAVPE
jgi:signal transduction histidine kinase